MSPIPLRGPVPRGIGQALVGIGGDSGGLAKLEIQPDTPKGADPVVALFNPDQIGLSRSMRWDHQEKQALVGHRSWNHGKLRFVGRDDETLSISLFFDTYEPEADLNPLLAAAADALWAGVRQGEQQAVTELTAKVVQLSEVVRPRHRPPVCTLSWGEWTIFTGVLTSLEQRFTMFLADGTPVRATLECTFSEFLRRGRARSREVHSADIDKTRTVRRGDTLHSLAAEEYGDPALWRTIARANGIRDPLALRPGTVLTLPRTAP